MHNQGRQQYPAPVFPPPPTEEVSREHPKMTTGLPNYAYRAIYDNQYNNHPLSPPAPRAGSHSHDSNRSQRSAHGSVRGRPEDDRAVRRHLEDGHYEGERRTRTSDRRRSRRPTSSYDSERSYDSRDTRHPRSDRRRSRSRRRSPQRDKRDRAVQKQQQQQQPKQQQPAEEKKTGFAKIEDYITPFNVGILMGCMDLIGGSISLYMTNKRFSKKALAKGPAPGEPGASSDTSGGGSDSGGGADKTQARSRSRGHRGRTSARHDARGRTPARHDERDRYSRRQDDSGEEDSDNSTGSSYWSRSDRRYRHMPERLEYDNRGRPVSGVARAARR